MKKSLSLLLVGLACMSYAVVYAGAVNGIISSEIIRFHIIAASDSEEDIEAKFDVRDYVSDKIAESEIAPYTSEYAKECERLANVRLEELGLNYRAEAKFERVYIPKKSYKGITLPSGKYNAIRLLLGKGEGENWWCVAYPPLCFTEDTGGVLSAEGTHKMKQILPGDIYDMITDETEYRFFIVDFVGKILKNTSL